MLEIGQRAPDFTLPDQDGKPVTLGELLRERAVVLFFYPKDETPICTAESCAFRDAYADLLELGASVIGVSGDGAESHRRFRENHRLPYPLLSDAGGKVAAQYGVSALFGLMAGRATFVIDRSGVVRHVTAARFRAEVHVAEARTALQRLGS
ncbi:MAG: peroxiredoxin [Deltaproteobacteria bacterium]|nr:peroxiredoxin [Deltaproteobacteria bacterium]